LRRCNAPSAAHSRLLCCLRSDSSAFNGWERDSPKSLYLIVIVLFDKLDCVSGNSLEGSQLRNDPSRSLSATLISYDDCRANQQLAIQLDGSSKPIQVGGFGGHREGTLLAIFTRQPHDSVEGHPTAPALRDLTAISAGSGP
jgi:hypothetical protein